LVNGKLSFRSQKELISFSSMTNMAVYISFISKKQLVNWLVMLASCFNTFNMLLFNRKLFSINQKDLIIIYLWASLALDIWLVTSFYHQNQTTKFIIICILSIGLFFITVPPCIDYSGLNAHYQGTLGKKQGS